MDKMKYNYENNKKHLIIKIFIFTEIILYISFLYLDITAYFSNNPSLFVLENRASISNALKFLSILVCFLFVALPYNKPIYDSRDLRILRLALLFTLISDYFLLFTEIIIFPLMTFIIVQMLYLRRIYRWDKGQTGFDNGKKRKVTFYPYLGINIILTILVILIVNISQRINILFNIDINLRIIILLSVFYFISLLMNFIYAYRLSRITKEFQGKLFATGLFLFILCDINVGLFNFFKIAQIANSQYDSIRNIAQIAMWLFYLPSQLMICLTKILNEK